MNAIGLLDEAASRLRLQHESKPEPIADLEREARRRCGAGARCGGLAQPPSLPFFRCSICRSSSRRCGASRASGADAGSAQRRGLSRTPLGHASRVGVHVTARRGEIRRLLHAKQATAQELGAAWSAQRETLEQRKAARASLQQARADLAVAEL